MDQKHNDNIIISFLKIVLIMIIIIGGFIAGLLVGLTIESNTCNHNNIKKINNEKLINNEKVI